MHDIVRKSGNIQSSVWGDISLKAEEGIIAGCCMREGVTSKAWHMLPRERWSAVIFITPGRWEAVMHYKLVLAWALINDNDKVSIATLKIGVVLKQTMSPGISDLSISSQVHTYQSAGCTDNRWKAPLMSIFASIVFFRFKGQISFQVITTIVERATTLWRLF